MQYGIFFSYSTDIFKKKENMLRALLRFLSHVQAFTGIQLWVQNVRLVISIFETVKRLLK